MKVFIELPVENRVEIYKLLVYSAKHLLGHGTGWLDENHAHYLNETECRDKMMYLDTAKPPAMYSSNSKVNGYKNVSLLQFLEALENKQEKITVGEHTVEFQENGIQVGCTFVDKETVKKIAQGLKLIE